MQKNSSVGSIWWTFYDFSLHLTVKCCKIKIIYTFLVVVDFTLVWYKCNIVSLSCSFSSVPKQFDFLPHLTLTVTDKQVLKEYILTLFVLFWYFPFPCCRNTSLCVMTPGYFSLTFIISWVFLATIEKLARTQTSKHASEQTIIYIKEFTQLQTRRIHLRASRWYLGSAWPLLENYRRSFWHFSSLTIHMLQNKG